MDFNCLSRNQLQTLCKQNKIPANITNVAMAGALSALHKVEGLEEFINGVESDNQKSPEKLMLECPDVPKTACGTTTRRKQAVMESLSVVSTRRSTRRSVGVKAEQENKNVNQLVTPATPVTRTRRIATAAGSTCQRCVGPEQKSLQRGDGTRHSMRLLEKSLREMNLKEEGKVEPVKFDVSESNKVSDGIVDKIGILEDFSSQNQSVKKEIDDKDKLPKDKSNTEYEMEKCCVKLEFDGDDNSGNTSGFHAKDEEDNNFNKLNEFEADPSTDENNETASAAMISEMSNEVNNDDVLLVVEMEDDIAASAMEAKNAETAASPYEEFSAPKEIKEPLKLQGLVGNDSEINSVQNDRCGNLEVGFDCKQLEEVQENETRESVLEQVSTVHCEKLASETEPEDHKLDHELEEWHRVSYDVEMEKENNESLSECDAITREELSESSIEANLEENIVLENAVSETSNNLEKMPEAEMIVSSIFECPSTLNSPTSKATGEMVSSSLAFATLEGLFPPPTVTIPGKPLTMKDSGLPTVNQVSKINITGMKLEAKKDEVNIMAKEEMLEALSIRKLTRMVKELQISKKNKEEKNANKAAKARLPLQRLPGNRMATTESGEE